MSGSPSPYTNSTTFSISGAPTSLPLVDHLTADLPAKAFGIVGGAVIASDGTLASGTDESAKATAYHDWCRTRGVQPNYAGIDNVLIRTTTVPIYGPGNYPKWVAPNCGTSNAVLSVAPADADVEEVPLADVNKWTGTRKGSIKIGGLTAGLKGKLISVDTGSEKLIGRCTTDFYRVGQSFYVNDDAGHIGPALTQDWNTLNWTMQDIGKPSERSGVKAQTVRERVSIDGLSVTLYKPTAGDGLPSGVRELVVLVTRANTAISGVRIRNRSGAVVAAGLVIANTGFVTVDNSSVTGIGEDDTNYSFSLGLTCEVDLYGNNATDARTSLDIKRGVNTRIWGGSYLERVGAHWGVGTTIVGALIGGVHIAGGDLQIIGGRQILDGDEPGGGNVVNIRQDSLEFTGQLYIGGGFTSDIDVTNSAGDAVIVNFRGGAGAADPLRPVWMPDNIHIDDSVQIRIRGNNTARNLLLVNGLRPFGDFRRDIYTEGRIYCGAQVKYSDGVLINSVDSLPRTRFQLTRTSGNSGTNKGRGYDIHIKGVPGIYVELGAQLKVGQEFADLSEFPRHAVTVEGSTGPVAFRLSHGAFRKAVTIDCVTPATYTFGGGSNPFPVEMWSRSSKAVTSPAGSDYLALGDDGGVRVRELPDVATPIVLAPGTTATGRARIEALGPNVNKGLEFWASNDADFAFKGYGGAVTSLIVSTAANGVNVPWLKGAAEGGDVEIGVLGTSQVGNLRLGARGASSQIKSNRPHALFAVNVATLPSATTFAGCSVRVTNRDNRTAVSDGSVWRFGDNTVVA